MSNFILDNTAEEINEAIHKVTNPDTTLTGTAINDPSLVTAGAVKSYVDTRVSEGGSITINSFAGSSLETSSDGLTLTDDAVPTSAAVVDYVARQETLTIWYGTQSKNNAYFVPAGVNSNFDVTSSNGQFNLPSGTYLYDFKGSTSAGTIYRVMLSFNGSTSYILDQTGWSSGRDPIGFHNIVSTGGTLGLYGHGYGSQSIGLTKASLTLHRLF